MFDFESGFVEKDWEKFWLWLLLEKWNLYSKVAFFISAWPFIYTSFTHLIQKYFPNIPHESEDSNDFNLNVGDEDEQILAYLHFGMNGDKAIMEAWLSKIIAYKRNGTYEEWWSHSD